MKIRIKGTAISATDRCALAEGNVDSLFVDFELSSEWDSLIKTAVFANGAASISLPITESRHAIPWEVLAHTGELYVALRGTTDGGGVVYCTGNALLGHVQPSLAAVIAAEHREKTPDVIDELEAEVAALGAAALQTAPVSSVNGKTGAVNLVPADLGIGSVFALKGSKPTYADLPASGNTIGDVWYVVADSVGYICLNDGTADRWEQLGMDIDISAFYTKTESDNKFAHNDDLGELQTKAITDTAGYFTDKTVEGALTEIGAKLAEYPNDVWQGGSY